MNTLAVGREKDRYAVRDKKTGKETDAFAVLVSKWVPHPYHHDGAQVSQAVLRDLAKNPNLTKRALRIALYLISRIEKGNPLRLRRDEMAQDLGMHKSGISRGLRELFDHGRSPSSDGEFFSPILPPARKPVLGVRPTAAWKGTARDLSQAIKHENENETEERLRIQATAESSKNRHPSSTWIL